MLVKTTNSKCLLDLVNGPDINTECWIHPLVPKSGKLIFGGYSKTGKALRSDQLVLLKNGQWRTIADVEIGDELAAVDNQPSKIIGKEYHFNRRLFKVTFSDGTSSIAADDHLWEVYAHNWKRNKSKVLTTESIKNLLPQLPYGIYIPLFTGDFGSNEPLPIDPYILGALLGDGCFTGHTVEFSSADKEIINIFSNYLGADAIYQKPNDLVHYRFKTKRFLENALEKLNLKTCVSHTKFIPSIYLQSSRENRLALLQGLMDTDGSVGKTGNVEFCTTSPQLASDVVALIRSLGWGCTYYKRQTTYTYNGERRIGRESYRIFLRGGYVDCFRLNRKLIRAAGKYKRYLKRIILIEQVENAAAVCIEVSHPRGLFITNDYIVTHNSHIMLSMARALTTQEPLFACPRFRVTEPARVLLFEQELGEGGLQRRARMVFNNAQLQKDLHYISRNPDISFSTEAGYEVIGNEIAEFKPNVVILDPIGKLYHGDENSAQEVGLLWQKIDKLLRLGSREQMSIVLSHHFGKRVNGDRNREGHDPLDAYNFRGSSKWFDDVDALITVNRLQNLPGIQHQAWRLQMRFELRHEEVPPEMFFTVNLNRDLRVIYEREVEPPQPVTTPAPMRVNLGRNNVTTNPVRQ